MVNENLKVTSTEEMEADWRFTGLTSGLLIFFVVFYQSHCYTRYCLYYKHCMAIEGAMEELALELEAEGYEDIVKS